MATTEICGGCGSTIVLKASGQHFKWVLAARPARMQWKCEPTPEFPVRSHAPREAETVKDLIEQIAKRALDGICQTLTLPEVGLMERAADGSVYFEIYTPNHGTFRVMVTAT